MGSQAESVAGPDLASGVSVAEIGESGLLEGHVGDAAVVLARCGDALFAVGARCTHYGGPLAQGIVVDGTVRCPWHHACFSLRTGEALAAPAFDPVECWKVERRGDRVFVRERRAPQPRTPSPGPAGGGRPQRIVIVGGGAAGFAAAEMLRRRGFGGALTMLSADADAPYDRPNLSKDYLAGSAPEDWIPLRPPEFYAENRIDLRLRTTVERIDLAGRTVVASDGGTFPFDRLLLATGAEPVRLTIPGADRPHVRVLRSLADSRAIVERAQRSRAAVVLGAGFIGLETASALRARGLEVHVVAPDARPLERVLGPELGDFIRALHERHGVRFHLQETAIRIDERSVALSGGGALDADLVVAGVGVRPRIALAEKAGLALDRGILVDAHLETSVPGIFAAGDVARWPDARTGDAVRIEHWVVAERQGQTAAANMLGDRVRFSAVPFFWTAQYDAAIHYVGHAERWDAVEIDGSVAARDCLVRYRRDGRTLAAASMGRAAETLRCEAAMERAA